MTYDAVRTRAFRTAHTLTHQRFFLPSAITLSWVQSRVHPMFTIYTVLVLQVFYICLFVSLYPLIPVIVVSTVNPGLTNMCYESVLTINHEL